MQPDKEQLEARLHYPLVQALPEPGRALVVAPGVKWLRMALPFALDHINLWLLRDTQDGCEGWTAVDCCIAHDASKAQWESIFANELEGLPVLRVVVTHMHPDHIGLAHWLCQRWTTAQHDCRLWISATDHAMACIASQSTTGFGGETAAAFFAAQGLTDADQLAQIRGRTSYYPNLVPAVPRQYRRLMDGGQLSIGGRAWQCISGYGHAPEHMALHCPELGVLISGDMVLPSHGKPFTGLHERIQQLKDHHADRLAEVLEACQARPCSAADILPVMFKRPLDLHQTTFAMGEAVAHLHRLWQGGQLVRSRGVDGVFRFLTV